VAAPWLQCGQARIGNVSVSRSGTHPFLSASATCIHRRRVEVCMV
jgi:hypothetical protein